MGSIEKDALQGLAEELKVILEKGEAATLQASALSAPEALAHKYKISLSRQTILSASPGLSFQIQSGSPLYLRRKVV